MNKEGFAFDCPVHGIEIQIFCWRGFQEENRDRWFEYEFQKVRNLSNEEFQTILLETRQQSTSASA